MLENSMKMQWYKKIILYFLILAPLVGFSEGLVGYVEIDATYDLTLKVTIDSTKDQIKIQMSGPNHVYYSFGFGSRKMEAGTYAVVANGDSNLIEQSLGQYSAGNQLTSSFQNTTMENLDTTSRYTSYRNIEGLDSNYFDFSGVMDSSSVDIIWATGVSQNLTQHPFSDRGASRITFYKQCFEIEEIDTSACKKFKSPGGKKIWRESGMYQDTIYTFNACDSILNVNVTIDKVNVAVNQSNNVLTSQFKNGEYAWLDCDKNFTAITNETDSSFVPMIDGNYAVEITAGDCVDTSSCFSVINTGILESSFDSEISIYPNPFSNAVNIMFGELQNEISVYVTTLNGQHILSKSFRLKNNIMLQIPGSKQYYLIKIQSGKRAALLKVLKQ